MHWADLGWDIGDPGVTNGWTMLHRAVRDDLHHDNEVRMLVKKGDGDVIHKLAAASGGINVKDRLGLTPLHHAVRGRLVHEEEMWRDYDKGTWREADFMSNLVPTKANMSLVRSLIASGSDPSDIDRYGHSVLWHAKYFGQDEVTCLLEGDLEFAIPDQSKENIQIAVNNGNEIDEDNGIGNNPLVDLLHKVPPPGSNATTWPRVALREFAKLQLQEVHSNDIQVRTCDKSHEMVTWESDVPSEAISLMAGGKMLPLILNYVRQKAKNDENLRADLHRSSPPETPEGKPSAIENLLRSPAINPGFRNRGGVLEVHEQMDCVVQRLVQEMNDISPMLQLRVILGGSVSEKTKIGLPDEYDYRLYIGALDGKCSVVREIEYDLSVPSWQRRTVNIQVSDDVSSSWSSYCDNSNVIDAAALFMHVHGVMYKALSRDIWEGLDMYWKPYGRNALHVQWMGKHWHGMAIKADIMYCVEIQDWWPTTVRQESHLLPNIKSNPCCVLLRPPSFQPSSCELEHIVMSQLSDEMKTVYSIGKLVNRLTDYSCKEDKVTSYDLKNALFYYMEMNGQTENFSSGENPEERENKKCEYSWGGSYNGDSESLPLMVKHLRTKTLQVFHDGLSLLREHTSYYFGISRWAEKEDQKIRKANQQEKFEQMLLLL
ncbi:uncharacterized protein LOC117108546 [Anneissia japonica]|uniref:uncharacterized protein LOC117108546 n=1 Tax=Anneissia japonica TaxID=1529436 RepID=UPI0014255051|nr:uncharacterized protein LOC117108546 [Anneissia japonica]